MGRLTPTPDDDHRLQAALEEGRAQVQQPLPAEPDEAPPLPDVPSTSQIET